jgi:periplasmic protein CpxP/Spy
MNKVKLLSILCIGLVIVNIAIIYFFVVNKPHNHKGEGPKKVVIEKLGFDEKQIEDYEKLITWHRREVRKSEEKLSQLKNKLYSTLPTNDALNLKDSLILKIGAAQMEMENIHYKHFSDIKALCKAEQLKRFEALTLEITNLFSRPRPK